MKDESDISVFCGEQNEARDWMRTPWRRGDDLVATNGRVLALVRGAGTRLAPSDPPGSIALGLLEKELAAKFCVADDIFQDHQAELALWVSAFKASAELIIATGAVCTLTANLLAKKHGKIVLGSREMKIGTWIRAQGFNARYVAQAFKFLGSRSLVAYGTRDVLDPVAFTAAGGDGKRVVWIMPVRL